MKEDKKVSLSSHEYRRLKHIDKKFGELFAYFSHLSDIQKSRNEIGEKKFVSQDKLFKQLGI